MLAVHSHKAITSWLGICCLFVFFMVVLGGVTRLTDSGLSITEWQPIMGAIPPLSHQDWITLFDKYKTTTEYQTINHGMSLEEFEFIFWMEYAHRLLGRVLGFVFLIPFLWFWSRGALTSKLRWRFLGFLLLGAAQGVMGWLMVKSGLADRPDVSPYRLTAHLTLAFLLFGLLFWAMLSVYTEWKKRPAFTGEKSLRTLSMALVGLVLCQVILGGFVAGLDAGLTYNTYPKMDGQWVPNNLMLLEPRYLNFFEHITMVQFQHRMGAHILAVYALIFVVLGLRKTWKMRALKRGFIALAVVMAAQMAIGVLTLIHVVPIPLAALHQAVAVVLYAVSLYLCHFFYATVPIKKEKPQP